MNLTDIFNKLKSMIPTKITGNPALDGLLFKLIASGAAVATTWISVTLKINDPEYIAWIGMAIFGGIVLLASLVWGWLVSNANLKNGVMAGARFVASGAAQFEDAGNGLQKLAPVTEATAKAVLKEYVSSPAVKLAPEDTDKLKTIQPIPAGNA